MVQYIEQKKEGRNWKTTYVCQTENLVNKRLLDDLIEKKLYGYSDIVRIRYKRTCVAEREITVYYNNGYRIIYTVKG